MKKELFCVFVCMLMMLTTIALVSANTVSKTTSYPQSIGNMLYVGGSGPNNFTKIQDAIDNASDGDTVYVFDDMSPYYENIKVEKSITIQGENKHTTIIDGGNSSNGVDITADNVTVTGFTIQHCNNDEQFLSKTSGIVLSSSNSNIMGNILTQNEYGISNFKNLSLPPRKGHHTITNNQFINNDVGVYFVNESNDTISHNIFSQSGQGINLQGALNTNISFNIISENGGGIMMIYTSHTVVYRNNLTNNNGGVAVVTTNGDQILQNNFIGNKKFNAVSSQQYLYKNLLCKFFFHTQIIRNEWNENYWDRPRMLPHVIFGVFKLTFCIDWHPAQEPYDISGVK
jgi:parallel beta-helix repeat protein